jgi:hypothetical protein
MKNTYIFTEFECPVCYSKEHKQIPDNWNDNTNMIISYHEDFYFCIHCGIHTKFHSTTEKSYA